MNYRVRRMAGADVEAAVALAAGLPMAPHWPPATYLAALDPDAQPRRIALVAESWEGGGQIAGFALASVIPPEGELESICVAEAYQRQGVARRLFEVLSGDLRGNGVSELFLEVRASNAAALGLYAALGFEEKGRRPGYYTAPQEDAVLLRRQIGPNFE